MILFLSQTRCLRLAVWRKRQAKGLWLTLALQETYYKTKQALFVPDSSISSKLFCYWELNCSVIECYHRRKPKLNNELYL